jgi:indolepyruvate ferredoxin oxidoreductase, beta subunit
MKTDIIIAGVGGQGILSIAACIGMAAVWSNLHLKQAEVHGMSQRGGAVQSNLRLSDKEISSDLIPLGGADLIISVEPMESLRYLPWLKSEGWVVTNTTPVKNITGYPDPDDVIAEIKALKYHIIIDADTIARDIGSSRMSNMVILGAASSFISIELEKLESAIARIFEKKGDETVRMNIQALKAGREFSGTRKS